MVAREAPGQHLLVRVLWNSGFGEGWALRMVVDSGIHTRGMGYDEAMALLRQSDLGEHFDLREFHDQVLTRGNVTLSLLRELVEEWIDSRESARATH
jgi:uncharacterized protein (DUF885 family)